MNHKRLFRLYRKERLIVRRRGGRKRALAGDAVEIVRRQPSAVSSRSPGTKANSAGRHRDQ